VKKAENPEDLKARIAAARFPQRVAMRWVQLGNRKAVEEVTFERYAEMHDDELIAIYDIVGVGERRTMKLKKEKVQ